MNLSITPDLYTQKKKRKARKAGRRKRASLPSESVLEAFSHASLLYFRFFGPFSALWDSTATHVYGLLCMLSLVHCQNYFFPPNYLNRLLLCAFAIPLSETTPFSIRTMNYDTHHKIRGLHCGKVPWPHFGDVPGAESHSLWGMHKAYYSQKKCTVTGLSVSLE